MNLKVRQARTSDFERVGQFIRTVYRGQGKNLNLSLDHKNQFYMFHFREQLVAVLELSKGPDDFLVENLCVAKEHQGQGIGKRVLQFAEGLAQKEEVEFVRLNSARIFSKNVIFYLSAGYKLNSNPRNGNQSRTIFSKRIKR